MHLHVICAELLHFFVVHSAFTFVTGILFACNLLRAPQGLVSSSRGMAVTDGASQAPNGAAPSAAAPWIGEPYEAAAAAPAAAAFTHGVVAAAMGDFADALQEQRLLQHAFMDAQGQELKAMQQAVAQLHEQAAAATKATCDQLVHQQAMHQALSAATNDAQEQMAQQSAMMIEMQEQMKQQSAAMKEILHLQTGCLNLMPAPAPAQAAPAQAAPAPMLWQQAAPQMAQAVPMVQATPPQAQMPTPPQAAQMQPPPQPAQAHQAHPLMPTPPQAAQMQPPPQPAQAQQMHFWPHQPQAQQMQFWPPPPPPPQMQQPMFYAANPGEPWWIIRRSRGWGLERYCVVCRLAWFGVCSFIYCTFVFFLGVQQEICGMVARGIGSAHEEDD